MDTAFAFWSVMLLLVGMMFTLVIKVNSDFAKQWLPVVSEVLKWLALALIGWKVFGPVLK